MANERLQQITGHLGEIPQVAGSSTGKRLEGKVAIITGMLSLRAAGRFVEVYSPRDLRLIVSIRM